jgi:hypothetical protein
MRNTLGRRRGSEGMSRWVALIALAGILTMGGCAHPASPGGSETASSVPLGSKVGTYSAGARIVLAGGASLRVPVGCTARVLSTGGLATADSHDGKGVLLHGWRKWFGTAEIRVFASAEVFNDQAAAAESLCVRNQAGFNRTSYEIARVELKRSDVDSLTAYIVTDQRLWQSTDVVLYARRTGALPFRVFVDSAAEGPQSASQPSDALPAHLIKYFDLRFR